MRLAIVNNTIGHPHLRAMSVGKVWVARIHKHGVPGEALVTEREFLKRASRTSARVTLPKDLKVGDSIEFAHDLGASKERHYYHVTAITSDLHLKPCGGPTTKSALAAFTSESLLAELARRGITFGGRAAG